MLSTRNSFISGFSIEGPSHAKIDCKDNGDGSADVTYYPTAPGEYAVHVLCDEEDIPNSPYMANITPATKDFDAAKVHLLRIQFCDLKTFLNITLIQSSLTYPDYSLIRTPVWEPFMNIYI